MIRAAVIGVGRMGQHHARIYAELPGVELCAIADPDEGSRAAVAERHGVRAYAGHRELFAREKVDVVSVAVPTTLHHDVVVAAFDAGAHVLVEKPIASTVEAGAHMIERGIDQGCLLSVGHVERFNPALVELKRRIDGGEIGRVREVHGRRMSPPPARSRDTGVALDLGTHEINLLCHIVGEPITRVFAETARTMTGPDDARVPDGLSDRLPDALEDSLVGCLRFAGGAIGSLNVGWGSPTRTRECRVVGPHGAYLVDYLRRAIVHVPVGEPEDPAAVPVEVPDADPLRDQLQSFVDAVAGGRVPVVTAWDGLFAVAIAHMLIESGRTGRAIEVHRHIADKRWPRELGARMERSRPRP